MTQSYESKQSTLLKKLAELEEAEASYGDEKNSIGDCIANAKRFIDIQELTSEIVHAFIPKIYVYEKKEKWSHPEGNDIDIVFTVGFGEQHTERTSDAIASYPNKNRKNEENSCLGTSAAYFSTKNPERMRCFFDTDFDTDLFVKLGNLRILQVKIGIGQKKKTVEIK